ncbi:unnamed protein product [Calicophoron daubneyi]|uniref:Uncharacterized protein n=1 Tax=Calicophoron daubneyi TaxID=300641 RepID=A0AAV2TNR4_CALDB
MMNCLAIGRTSRKNLLLVSSTVMILLYFYICPDTIRQTQLNSEETLIRVNTSQSNRISSEIHLAFVVDHGAFLTQFNTLIKNILYYQGRYHTNRTECELNIQTIRNGQCPKRAQSQPVTPIHLRLLVSDRARNATTAYFNEWNLPHIRATFYNWSLAASETRRIRTRYTLNDVGIMKILWPEILGSEVQRIIILDTDLMFNRNIQELWNMFDLFNDEQTIGGIFEQLDNLQNNMATAQFPILKTGINSGVLLLQLDRMRQLNWAQLWRSVGERMQNDEGGVNFGEQGIINTILYRKPNLLFELPCEWNYIAAGTHIPGYCPFTWVVGIPDRENCLPTRGSEEQELHLAAITHLCALPQPEEIIEKDYSGNPRPVTELTAFTVDDVRNTFMEVYYSFRNMDKRCFF